MDLLQTAILGSTVAAFTAWVLWKIVRKCIDVKQKKAEKESLEWDYYNPWGCETDLKSKWLYEQPGQLEELDGKSKNMEAKREQPSDGECEEFLFEENELEWDSVIPWN